MKSQHGFSLILNIIYIICTQIPINLSKSSGNEHGLPSLPSPIEFNYHHQHNCSVYRPIPYNMLKFEGNWNYIELFTKESNLENLRLSCLKLNSRVIKSTIYINVTISNPEMSNSYKEVLESNPSSEEDENSSILIGNVFGWVDEDQKIPSLEDIIYEERRRPEKEPGRWKLFSKGLVPSKWIILSNYDDLHLLYISCGDFPDKTCAIGEIGIISRNKEIPYKIIQQFNVVLKKYNLHHVNRIKIGHKLCPNK